MQVRGRHRNNCIVFIVSFLLLLQLFVSCESNDRRHTRVRNFLSSSSKTKREEHLRHDYSNQLQPKERQLLQNHRKQQEVVDVTTAATQPSNNNNISTIIIIGPQPNNNLSSSVVGTNNASIVVVSPQPNNVSIVATSLSPRLPTTPPPSAVATPSSPEAAASPSSNGDPYSTTTVLIGSTGEYYEEYTCIDPPPLASSIPTIDRVQFQYYLYQAPGTNPETSIDLIDRSLSALLAAEELTCQYNDTTRGQFELLSISPMPNDEVSNTPCPIESVREGADCYLVSAAYTITTFYVNLNQFQPPPLPPPSIPVEEQAAEEQIGVPQPEEQAPQLEEQPEAQIEEQPQEVQPVEELEEQPETQLGEEPEEQPEAQLGEEPEEQPEAQLGEEPEGQPQAEESEEQAEELGEQLEEPLEEPAVEPEEEQEEELAVESQDPDEEQEEELELQSEDPVQQLNAQVRPEPEEEPAQQWNSVQPLEEAQPQQQWEPAEEPEQVWEEFSPEQQWEPVEEVEIATIQEQPVVALQPLQPQPQGQQQGEYPTPESRSYDTGNGNRRRHLQSQTQSQVFQTFGPLLDEIFSSNVFNTFPGGENITGTEFVGFESVTSGGQVFGVPESPEQYFVTQNAAAGLAGNQQFMGGQGTPSWIFPFILTVGIAAIVIAMFMSYNRHKRRKLAEIENESQMNVLDNGSEATYGEEGYDNIRGTMLKDGQVEMILEDLNTTAMTDDYKLDDDSENNNNKATTTAASAIGHDRRSCVDPNCNICHAGGERATRGGYGSTPPRTRSRQFDEESRNRSFGNRSLGSTTYGERSFDSSMNRSYETPDTLDL